MQTLREARLRKFLSIRELAKAAGVTTKTIVDVEAGRVTPRGATMRRIADALDTDPAEIVEFAAAVDAAIEEGKDAA